MRHISVTLDVDPKDVMEFIADITEGPEPEEIDAAAWLDFHRDQMSDAMEYGWKNYVKATWIGLATTEAIQFFREHGGHMQDPKTETEEEARTRCATSLARAEWYAKAQGWEFDIDPDPDADESWMDDEDRREWSGKAWYCQLWNADRTNLLASLSGCFGDADYKRVVKAELALEAMNGRRTR
jgi:hypothetical protein